jgi:CTP:molybdopterin cytidylyltransferase MocA
MEGSDRFSEVSLVVLAAGMGSRFGGLKQLFPVGLKRQTVLEYTLDDAQALGIARWSS